jgi:hypothetical protein
MTTPFTDLRTNVLTLPVLDKQLPMVAAVMQAMLPNESYDPNFCGQSIETTYFDTPDFLLRKARLTKENYCTLRIRCYGYTHTYAISAKTKEGKFRTEVDNTRGLQWATSGIDLADLSELLPSDIFVRLLGLAGDASSLLPVVRVCFTRYAAEDDVQRLTLDVGTETNTGKRLTSSVLECKTTENPAVAPPEILALNLPVIKLSKFLWATSYGGHK